MQHNTWSMKGLSTATINMNIRLPNKVTLITTISVIEHKIVVHEGVNSICDQCDNKARKQCNLIKVV